MTLGAKLQPICIFSAAVLGLLRGNFTALGKVSTGYIEFFLMLLLYILFVGIDLKQLKRAFQNVKYTCTAVAINFVITPIIAYLLGMLFFRDSLEIRIGLLMLLVTPCTDWYLVFTGLAKGNVELNLSILPINLVLQIALMPVYLYVFLGSEVQMQAFTLVQSIVSVLLIPFAMALLTNKVLPSEGNAKAWLGAQSDNLQLLFLCLAVVVMFASESDSLAQNPSLLLKLFLPLVLFFALLFFITRAVGRLLRFEKRDMIALHFTTLARNSPLSLAIAVAVFSAYPLTSLALVVGPLIELPILSLVASVLLKWKAKEESAYG